MDIEREIFEIRIQGHLSPEHSEWFGGMIITNLLSGESTLVGPVVDQSALHGLLTKIHDMNLKIISVRKMN